MGTKGRYVFAAALMLLALGACKETDEGKPAGGSWTQLPATPANATPGSTGPAPNPDSAAGGAGGAGGSASAAWIRWNSISRPTPESR